VVAQKKKENIVEARTGGKWRLVLWCGTDLVKSSITERKRGSVEGKRKKNSEGEVLLPEKK